MDKVTRRLKTQHKIYPMGFEPLEQGPEGMEPDGYRRRYVCRRLRDADVCLSVGVRDSFAEWVTPLWLRFHKDTRHFTLVRQRVASSSLRWLESGGHIWIPLDLPLGVPGDRMVEALAEQAEAVVRVVYEDAG